MKISIWQQFSSNHSAGFTVVGSFDSYESAATAANVLRHIVSSIAAWHEQPENSDVRNEQYQWAVRKGRGELTPDETIPFSDPEREISQQYDVHWEQPLDWLFDSKAAEQAVAIFENNVSISDCLVRESWCGPHPFDYLMERLGAKKAVAECETWGNGLEVFINCLAPDEATLLFFRNELASCNHYMDINGEMAFWTYSPDGDEIILASWLNSEGLEIGFRNICFYSTTLFDELPKFIAYLKGRGCTNITYSIESDS